MLRPWIGSVARSRRLPSASPPVEKEFFGAKEQTENQSFATL